jgi:hypothetical protein
MVTVFCTPWQVTLTDATFGCGGLRRSAAAAALLLLLLP